MNTNLETSFGETGKIIFGVLQNHRRERAKNIYDLTSKNQECIDFWNNVANYFKNNEISDYQDSSPCSFIPDSPSAGRHHQHCYIADNSGKLFQIDALTNRKYLLDATSELPLGAIAEAMIKGDISGIDDWYSSFNTFANNNLISDLTVFIEDIEENDNSEDIEFLELCKSKAIKDIRTFYSSFFFWNVHTHDKKISEFHYDGILDLEKIITISKDINEDNFEDFKKEAKRLIFEHK